MLLFHIWVFSGLVYLQSEGRGPGHGLGTPPRQGWWPSDVGEADLHPRGQLGTPHEHQGELMKTTLHLGGGSPRQNSPGGDSAGGGCWTLPTEGSARCYSIRWNVKYIIVNTSYYMTVLRHTDIESNLCIQTCKLGTSWADRGSRPAGGSWHLGVNVWCSLGVTRSSLALYSVWIWKPINKLNVIHYFG